jgi:UDP-glucose 4-epimerase
VKIAVTGAGGFLGRELIDFFATAEPSSAVNGLYSHKSVVPPATSRLFRYQGAMQDSALLLRWLEGCDSVLHLAERGFPSQAPSKPEIQIVTNLTNATRLVCAMREKGIRKLIYASSGGALYEGVRQAGSALTEKSPLNLRTPYSISKFLVERLFTRLIEEEGWDIKILRISNPYGIHQLGRSQQGVIGMALEKAFQDQPIPLWVPLTTSKDFIGASDVCRAFQLFLHGGEAGIYNIGSGQSCSLGKLFETIEKITGKTLKLSPRERDLQEPQQVALDCNRAKAAVSWIPNVPLEEGLTHLWKWRVQRKEHALAA